MSEQVKLGGRGLRIKVIKRIYINYIAMRNLGKGCYRQCIFKYISYAKRLPYGNTISRGQAFFRRKTALCSAFWQFSRIYLKKSWFLPTATLSPLPRVFCYQNTTPKKEVWGAPARLCRLLGSNIRQYCKHNGLYYRFCGSWRGRGGTRGGIAIKAIQIASIVNSTFQGT